MPYLKRYEDMEGPHEADKQKKGGVHSRRKREAVWLSCRGCKRSRKEDLTPVKNAEKNRSAAGSKRRILQYLHEVQNRQGAGSTGERNYQIRKNGGKQTKMPRKRRNGR